MKRLSELEPRWYTMTGSPDIVGITFNCPCCNGAKGTRLGVLFQQEIDRDGLPNDIHWGREGVKWDRTGDTFDTLTLNPSIDASRFGHWHGFVREGAIQ